MQTFQGPEGVRWSELEGDVPERPRMHIEEPYITSVRLEPVGTRAERGKRAVLIRRPWHRPGKGDYICDNATGGQKGERKPKGDAVSCGDV